MEGGRVSLFLSRKPCSHFALYLEEGESKKSCTTNTITEKISTHMSSIV